MKFYYFILLSLFLTITKSQSVAGPLPANTLSNNVAIGTPWNILSTTFADVTLNPYSSSKGMVGSNFNFSIPTTATIVGVEAVFSYSSTNLSDTIVKLVVGGIETGSNNAVGSTLSCCSRTYGASNSLWGVSSLNPSNVNSSNFGVVMYVNNPYSSATGIIMCCVPSAGLGMKIYYNPGTGIIESQTSFSKITVYPQPANDLVSIGLYNYNEPTIEIKIIDVNGRIIRSSEFRVWSGKAQLETSEFPNGVYTLQVISQNQIAIKRFVITK